MYINGLPVVNATKPVELDITDNDVAKGQSKDPASCAAAQALMRAGYPEARVHLSRTYFRQGKKWFRINTPLPVRTELIAFDRGAMFAPGHYIMNPLPPAKKKKPKAEGDKNTKSEDKKPTKKKSKPHRIYGVRQRGANV